MEESGKTATERRRDRPQGRQKLRFGNVPKIADSKTEGPRLESGHKREYLFHKIRNEKLYPVK